MQWGASDDMDVLVTREIVPSPELYVEDGWRPSFNIQREMLHFENSVTFVVSGALNCILFASSIFGRG